MAFDVEILTRSGKLDSVQASKVLLPAFDGGEQEVLELHEDFVGLLGTGLLKVSEAGAKELYYVVSNGVFRVDNKDGKAVLKLLAERGVSESELQKESLSELKQTSESEILLGSDQAENFIKSHEELQWAEAGLKVVGK